MCESYMVTRRVFAPYTVANFTSLSVASDGSMVSYFVSERKKKQTNYYYSGHLQTIYTNTSTKKRAVKSGTNVCGERFSEFASHFSDNSNFISSTYFSIISTFSTQLLFTRGRIAFCKLKNKYKAKIKRFHQ